MSLDSILNVLVPTLIVLMAVGFVWVKTPVGDWLGPQFRNFWSWIRGEDNQPAHTNINSRTIVYE